MHFISVLTCLMVAIEEMMELFSAKSDLHQNFFYVITQILNGKSFNTNKIYAEIVNANDLTKCIWLIIT